MGRAIELDTQVLDIAQTYASVHGVTLESAVATLIRLGNEPRVTMRRRDGAWVFDGPAHAQPGRTPSGDNHAPCTPSSMKPESSSPAV